MSLYLGGRIRISDPASEHVTPPHVESCLGMGVCTSMVQRPVDVFLDVGVVFDVRDERARRRLALARAEREERTIEMLAAFGDRYDPGGLHAIRRHAVRRFDRAGTERMR